MIRAFIVMILIYLSIKNRANVPETYSTLNPETSSPSIRPYGAWLVSARVEMNHILARGHDGMSSQINSCVVMSVGKLNESLIKRTDRRIIARIMSYEVVWTTTSSVPNSAYFELNAHPDPKRQ